MPSERLVPRRQSTLARLFDADTPAPLMRPRPTAPAPAPAPAPVVDNLSVTGEGLTFGELAAYVQAGIANGLSPDAPLTAVVTTDGRLLNLSVKTAPAPTPAPADDVVAAAFDGDEDALRALAEQQEQERLARRATKGPGPTRWA